MTSEQIALAKKLIKKYGIKGTDGEWSLVFLGVGYDLSEKQIETYLSMETSDLMRKHEKMLCILFGVELEAGSDVFLIENPAERLQFMFQEQFHGKRQKSYETVMQYIIKDTELSAAQIEQLRQAVEAEMPEEDVLEMARNRKDVMEIRRCVEFYQMTCKEKSLQQKSRREGRRESR